MKKRAINRKASQNGGTSPLFPLMLRKMRKVEASNYNLPITYDFRPHFGARMLIMVIGLLLCVLIGWVRSWSLVLIVPIALAGVLSIKVMLRKVRVSIGVEGIEYDSRLIPWEYIGEIRSEATGVEFIIRDGQNEAFEKLSPEELQLGNLRGVPPIVRVFLKKPPNKSLAEFKNLIETRGGTVEFETFELGSNANRS